MDRCAACGAAEGNGIKLKTCNACKSVKYCGVKCQKEHRPQHKRACKKRAAELKDEILFKQPEGNHLGDCPICCLPLPYNSEYSFTYYDCCSKRICGGCISAHIQAEEAKGVEHKCPFCRLPMKTSKKEQAKREKLRVASNDPNALYEAGKKSYEIGDYKAAFGYFSKAAELNDVGAHVALGDMYDFGHGVEKSVPKKLHHWETAAVAGHPEGRFNLGYYHMEKGQCERAIKHWLIATRQGYDDALEEIKRAYKLGFVKKDDFAAALRGYQAAVNEMKSPQRDAFEARDRVFKMMGGRK